MSGMLTCYRGGVNTWECDEMGHMNVRFYVTKAEEGLGVFASALGLTPDCHKANSLVSRLATFASHLAALRFRRLNRLYFLAAHRTNTRFRYPSTRLHSE